MFALNLTGQLVQYTSTCHALHNLYYYYAMMERGTMEAMRLNLMKTEAPQQIYSFGSFGQKIIRRLRLEETYLAKPYIREEASKVYKLFY